MEMLRSRADFDNSIEEIEYLNIIAKENVEHDKIYFKSIVLLLCAKLEKYVKDSAKEYINELLNLKLSSENIPSAFINQIIKNEVEKINKITVEKYVADQSFNRRSKVFSVLWNKKYVLDSLNVDEFTISISNNGTTAFEDVYKKIGLSDIIRNMDDYIFVTNIEGVETSTVFSIPDRINKVIWLRHNIIHDDATPSITINDIAIYIAIFKDFVRQVDESLRKEIVRLKGIA